MTIQKAFVALSIVIGWMSSAHAVVGWNVDCGNHCFFSEFPNNCQGVFWQYDDGTRSFSSWSTNYNGCLETNLFQGDTHVIYPAQIQCGCPAPTVFPPATNAPLTSATAEELRRLRAQIRNWAMCAPDITTFTPSDIFTPFTPADVKTCRAFRKMGKTGSPIDVNGCYSGQTPEFDAYWHPCDYSKDQVSHSIFDCFSGETGVCDDIKNAQDPVTGAWYRAPAYRKYPVTNRDIPLFSRDQMNGMFSYILKNNDKPRFLQWLSFIRNNQPKSPPLYTFFNVCPPRPNVPKPSQYTDSDWANMLADDRCAFLPSSAGMAYKIAQAVGITDAELQAIGMDLYSAMVSGTAILESSMLAESLTVPAQGGPSYQAALTVESALIRMHTPGGDNNNMLTVAQNINNRSNKLNPLFHYVAMGRQATEYSAYLIKKYCKPPKPNWGVSYTSGYQGHPNNGTDMWTIGATYVYRNYQIAGGVTVDGDVNTPNGHDCTTWINFLLGNSNREEPTCDTGDSLINNACRKHAFTKPDLAPVYGVDYKFNPALSSIDYMASNKTQCLYGGTYYLSGTWGRCRKNITTNYTQIFPANYTVDPNPAWPGIYYPQFNGTCPNGGSLSGGGNCQLVGFASPVIYPNVRYWVDTNPAYPGVYYQKVSGACPYGGTSSGPNCQLQGFASGFLDTSRIYFVRANPAYPGVYYYPSTLRTESVFATKAPNQIKQTR